MPKRPFIACFPTVRACRPKWTVESVAAAPEVRRQGMMIQLLNEIIARGRYQGFMQAQIAVLIHNTAARRAYEKCGFR
jgi:RimJ/RimL family protein N-acetyltransferase